MSWTTFRVSHECAGFGRGFTVTYRTLRRQDDRMSGLRGDDPARGRYANQGHAGPC